MDYLKKLYTKYFSVNLHDYGIDVNFEINKFLFFIAIGLCVACVLINYYQRNTALLLKKLIRLDAFSEEQSKTLSELRLSDNKAVKALILKNSGSVKKIVEVIGRKKVSYEEYITSEKQKKANKKHFLRKKTSAGDESGNIEPITSQGDGNVNTDIDFSTAKMYILPQMRSYAERAIRFDSSPVKTALYCLAILTFFAVIILTMPYILSIVSGIAK